MNGDNDEALQQAITRANRAVGALRLEVDAAIARDVGEAVSGAFKEYEAAIRRAVAKVAEPNRLVMRQALDALRIPERPQELRTLAKADAIAVLEDALKEQP